MIHEFTQYQGGSQGHVPGERVTTCPVGCFIRVISDQANEKEQPQSVKLSLIWIENQCHSYHERPWSYHITYRVYFFLEAIPVLRGE